jgi:uncharacterized protein
MRTIITLVFIALFSFESKPQEKGKILNFNFEGNLLNGILDFPENINPKGIVLIVHGSGRTSAVEQEWYLDVRQAIVKSGYATYMWDKMGCGKSEGTFDGNQTPQNSAMEVIAAITALKQNQIPGSDRIGLWGISRAGWINPIVINQYSGIKFWISVSGVDEKENFRYLLEKNLTIDGHSKETVDKIVDEWVEGAKLTHSGEDFGSFLAATPTLRQNKFWLRFTNGGITEENYYAYQKTFMKEELDKKSGLQVYVKDFESILSNIRCPVLALFGEKDMNVNWEQTKSLYKRTLGKNAELTIKSFPDCNHNLFQCNTGGFYEIEDNKLPWIRCNRFPEAMTNWLNQIEQLQHSK